MLIQSFSGADPKEHSSPKRTKITEDTSICSILTMLQHCLDEKIQNLTISEIIQLIDKNGKEDGNITYKEIISWFNKNLNDSAKEYFPKGLKSKKNTSNNHKFICTKHK